MHQFFWPGTCESWFGVCPGNVELAGKRKPRHTTQGNVWLQRVLDEVAWAAGRFKETVFATQFRRLAGHCGNQRAIMAVAHSRLVVLEPAVGGQDRADEENRPHLA